MLQKERLLTLANHLEFGQLGVDQFHFNQFHERDYPLDNGEEIKCGTVGCALGECPVLWPEHWHLQNGNRPLLKNIPTILNPFSSAQNFFGISESAALHLFNPCSQAPGSYGGQTLDVDATKEDVASNIREFVSKVC